MSDTRKNAPPKGSPATQTPPGRAAQAVPGSEVPPPPAWAKASVAWPFKAAPSLAQCPRRKP